MHAVGWRYMLASCAIPAGLFVLLLLFVPETPRGLMLKGKNAKALEVLNKLANADEAKIVLAEIDASLKETSGKLFAYGGLVLVRRHHVVAVPAVRGHQRGAVLRPADVQEHGLRSERLAAQTVIMGIVMVVFTLVATATVDKWGRKPLLILGALIMAVSMIALGFLFYSGNVGLAALGRGLHLHRGLLAVLGSGGVGDARGNLPELHPQQGHGHRRRRAVDHELFVSWTFNILDGHSGLTASFNHGFAYWLYGGFSVLAAAVRLEVRAGDQGQVAREHADALARRPRRPESAIDESRGACTAGFHFRIYDRTSSFRLARAVLVGRILTREGPRPSSWPKAACATCRGMPPRCRSC